MNNLVKMILTIALITTTCCLFAHNGDIRRKDAKRDQNNCPQQHRNGGNGNQQYPGEQYSGEKYQGEDYQAETTTNNCQVQKQCNNNSSCNYNKSANCKKQKSNCTQKQKCVNKKGCSMQKKDGNGPHNHKKQEIPN